MRLSHNLVIDSQALLHTIITVPYSLSSGSNIMFGAIFLSVKCILTFKCALNSHRIVGYISCNAKWLFHVGN